MGPIFNRFRGIFICETWERDDWSDGCSSFYGERYHCGKVSGNGGSCVWQWHRRTMYHCGSASLWVMEWCGVAFDGGSMALIGVPTTRRCIYHKETVREWWIKITSVTLNTYYMCARRPTSFVADSNSTHFIWRHQQQQQNTHAHDNICFAI